MIEGLEEVQAKDEKIGFENFLEKENEVYSLPTGYLSFSQIWVWQTCGERYRRRYVNRERSPNSSNLGQGRLVHKVVEKLNSHKLENAGELPPRGAGQDIISDRIVEFTEDIEVWDPKVPSQDSIETSARELIDIYERDRLPTTRPRALEVKIQALLKDSIPYVGYIDMIEKSQMDDSPLKPFDGMHEVKLGDAIRDLKSTGKKYGPQRVANSLQLSLYAGIVGVENVGFDLLVQKKRSEFVKQDSFRTPGELDHALDVVEDVAKAIDAGFFPRTDPEAWVCSEKWCPFFKDCRGRDRSIHTTGPVEGLEEANG